MKKTSFFIFFVIPALLRGGIAFAGKNVSVCVPASQGAASSVSVGLASLRKGFENPPEGSRLQTWFHWVSDDVTRAGLAADLKAMGEMEIGTAHIYLPAAANLPHGPKPLTPEWCELFSFAAQEAKKNKIRLGLHNCPGWSSSGGPWIQPKDSMKIVVTSETDVEANAERVRLVQPMTNHGFYRDIAVLAFPIRKQIEPVHAQASFPADTVAFLAAKKPLILPIIKPGDTGSLSLEYNTPPTPRFAIFHFTDEHLFLNAEIQGSPDGKTFTKVGSFHFTFFRGQKTPKIVQLKNVPEKSRFFRFVFSYEPLLVFMHPTPLHLARITLTDLPMVQDVDRKNSASTCFQYIPPTPGTEKDPGIAADSVVNVTRHLRPDGTLAWRPQSGTWRILRMGFTTSGKMNAPATLFGLECDKLSKSGLDAHWPNFMAKILALPGVRDVLCVSLIDSYEVGGQNWTESLPPFFRERRGYDMMKFLPALVGYVIDTEETTAKFLFDYQKTVSELFAENYYDYFSHLCHENGLHCVLEPYGGPFDSIRCGKAADIPTGEFWLGGNAKRSPRIAASIGHLYGKAMIGAEAFTTEAKQGRWQATPKELKRYGEQGWLEGISQLVYHSYCHQPWRNVQPGVSLGRHGSQLNRNTTWWSEGIFWSRYVNRAQFLLQRGKSRADVLLLTGESTPNDYRYPNSLVEKGYNFDYCGVDALFLLHNEGTGVAMPNGLPYSVLYLGHDAYLSVATLKKIKSLLDGGAQIAGVRPRGTPCLADSPSAFASAVADIWGKTSGPATARSVGKGKLAPATDALQAVRAFSLPPAIQAKVPLRCLVREMDGCIVYFVSHSGDTPFRGKAWFRTEGRGLPEFWDAVTGKTGICPVSNSENGGTQIRLDLPAHGSTFVVFPPKENPESLPKVRITEITARGDGTDVRIREGKPYLAFSRPGGVMYRLAGETIYHGKSAGAASFPETVDLSSGWRVTFTGKNAPQGPTDFPGLKSWSDNDNPQIKYFSGTGHYTRTFSMGSKQLTPSIRWILDLGDVRELAHVKVNGKDLGCLWNPPYRVDVTEALKKGVNTVDLVVINTWPNRMIGDAIERKTVQEPMQGIWPKWVMEDRSDSGTGIYTWSNFKGWSEEDPLLPAGLLGPAVLRPEVLLSID